MQFRVLGPLEVESRDRVVRISAAKERTLLGLLLLRANAPVSRDRLIDELWGQRPPATARHTLEAYVSRLRRTLSEAGDGVLIETLPNGYVVRLDGHELDAARFEELLEEGRATLAAGDAGAARAVLRDGLALWRGEVLGDAVLDATVVEAARLEEQRLAALELRVDADLAVGHHRDLVAELAALVAAHPLRERFRAQLMLALYRSGRQADALAEYRAARSTLVDELGIEPGAELQELHAAMLRQDPALGAPAAAAGERRGRRRYAYVLAAGAVAAVALVAVVVAFDGGSGPLVVEANADGVLDARNGGDDRGAVGTGAFRVAAGAGSAWVTNVDVDTVSRIDPKTRTLRQTIRVGDGPAGVAVGAGFVWVTNSLEGTLAKISPRTNEVVDRIPVGAGPVDLTVGGGSVWVANSLEHTISQVDVRTDEPRRTIPSGGSGPSGVAFGAGSVWVANSSNDAVSRIDARTGSVEASIPIGGRPSSVVWSGGSLWVTSAEAGTATRIDPRRNLVVAAVPVAGSPASIATGAGAVWVASGEAQKVARIDPKRNAVVAELALENRPEGLAVVGDDLYVAVAESGRAHRGGTLRVLSDLLPLLDPVDGNHPEVFDCLVRCALHGAPIGPDLAVALPRPSDGGRTYRFTLRRGIRFSNGSLLRPTDVAHSVMRLFRLRAYGAVLLEGIVGGEACARTPKQCDLSRGVVPDDAANVVTFHLTRPDPGFLHRLAFAMVVPAATPFRKLDTQPIPGTGPYMVAEYRPGHLVRLVRNPYFREWAPAVQPDGYPDAIVTRMDRPPAKWLELVLRNEADVANPADEVQVRQAATQHPELMSIQPLPWTAVLTLNKRVRPFDDVRVRRAVNYAIDRRAIAKLYYGGGAPTCQWLPPNFPAHRRYCPYTIGGGRDGAWLGPDVAKARRLVAASGTRGMKVEYWAPRTPAIARATDYVVGLLRQLGYQVELKQFETEDYFFNRMADPRQQISWGWHWVPDFPTPAGFLSGLLGCGAAPPLSPATVCDEGLRADVERALALDLTDPAAATRVWTKIDHDLTDRAEWVWLYNLERRYVFSERVGNQGGALRYHEAPALAQLWVR